MAELPTGTVTFLFTDIEGSTRLLHELGDAYADVLAEHRSVLRSAFAEHGGVEVDTQGDAFFVAFARATDAVASAADAQRALFSTPMRVRMGIHTGEPLRTAEGYAGVDVHRGARLAAAGHGGQVLLSQAARELVGDDLSTEYALLDLGEHVLKDLTRPQRIFQLVAEGIDRDFPPLSTLASRPTNLPPQATPLIGRERELAEVAAVLGRTEVRVLTLTGPGGAGKTRIALHAAAELLDEFRHGAFFVDLAPVRDPAHVVPTIAQTLSVKEGAGRSLHEAVGEFLRERELLLVLDNFEHVVEAAPDVIELLLQAPSVKTLIASRAPMRVAGEHEYPVPELADSEAAALFMERAQAIQPAFQDGNGALIAEICRRLDGLPLAIELAAARIKLLTPQALLDRLDRRLPVLTGGGRDVPDRQRTLRDTIAWSYELLDDSDRRAFRRLAVFPGSCSLEAADEVCEAELDVLGSLVEKSLVRQEEGRLTMLETIREYASEQLDLSADAGQMNERHATYFLLAAEEHGSGPRHRSADAFTWWDDERENVLAAIAWARETSAEELEFRLLLAAAYYLELLGVYGVGPRIESLLERFPEAPAAIRARGLNQCASFSWRRGNNDSAREFAQEALGLARSSGSHDLVVHSLINLAIAAANSGRQDLAKAYYEEAEGVAREHKTTEHWAIAVVDNNLGNLALQHHDYAEARARFERSLAESRRHNLAFQVANNLLDLGTTDLAQHEFVQAGVRFRECLPLCESLGFRELLSWVFEGAAAISVSRDEAGHGARLLGAAKPMQEAAGIDGSYYPVGLELRERTTRAAKELIGESDFTSAWLAGKELGLEESVSLAKSALDEAPAPA
jgi:predicted ATPase/class 3 adenylate cyclase